MIKGNKPAAQSGLPRRRKILYYGIMLVLTLLFIEGMARLAYYAAYGHGYGGGAAADPDNLTPPPPPFSMRITTLLSISSPCG